MNELEVPEIRPRRWTFGEWMGKLDVDLENQYTVAPKAFYVNDILIDWQDARIVSLLKKVAILKAKLEAKP